MGEKQKVCCAQEPEILKTQTNRQTNTLENLIHEALTLLFGCRRSYHTPDL